jgi:hypothetical protein
MIKTAIGSIELADLLRSLESGRKNALVNITCPALKGRIYLQDGQIAYVQTSPGPHLGEYLVRQNLLSVEQVHDLLKYQQREKPGTP